MNKLLPSTTLYRSVVTHDTRWCWCFATGTGRGVVTTGATCRTGIVAVASFLLVIRMQDTISTNSTAAAKIGGPQSRSRFTPAAPDQRLLGASNGDAWDGALRSPACSGNPT